MIGVLLAEDQAMVRGALASLLGLEADIDVVAQVGRGDEVLEAARRAGPDVALLDIGMPGLDGLEVAELLRDELPAVRVLILTTFNRPGYLKRAMEAGAAGFLLKGLPADDLARAIRAAAEGRRVVDPGLAAAALCQGENPLTPREREVLEAARRHGTVAELAAALHLSPGTTRNTSPRSCRSSTRTAASRRSAWRRSAAGSESAGRAHAHRTSIAGMCAPEATAAPPDPSGACVGADDRHRL